MVSKSPTKEERELEKLNEEVFAPLPKKVPVSPQKTRQEKLAYLYSKPVETSKSANVWNKAKSSQ